MICKVEFLSIFIFDPKFVRWDHSQLRTIVVLTALPIIRIAHIKLPLMISCIGLDIAASGEDSFEPSSDKAC